MRRAAVVVMFAAACGSHAAHAPDAAVVVDASPDAAPDADTLGPHIASTTPNDQATEVANGTSITVVFDETIDRATLTGASFLVRELETGAAITGTVTTTATGGTFAPAKALATDRTYVATITTAVTDVRGNALASEATWSFATHRRTLGPVTPVETTTDAAQTPQIAVDGSGNAIAIWRQDVGSIHNLWTNRFTLANGWGTAELLETMDAGSAQNARLAINSTGTAAVVWEQDDGTTHTDLYVRRYVPATGWDTATKIGFLNGASAYGADLAIDTSGRITVVWAQFPEAPPTNTHQSIYAQRFAPSTGWAAAQLIEQDESGHANNATVVMDASGNATAVWTIGNAGASGFYLWSNRFTGSSWGTPETVDAGNSTYSLTPQLGVDPAGNVTVAWSELQGQYTNIRANRYVPGTGWNATSALLETENQGGAYLPQLAVGKTGVAFAVWQQFDGGVNNVLANHFDGTAWGTSVHIDASMNASYYPDVAVDDTGDALVVWAAQDGTEQNLYVTRNRGGMWDPPALLETASGTATYVSVAVGGGIGLAIWQQDDGTGYSVLSRLLQ